MRPCRIVEYGRKSTDGTSDKHRETLFVLQESVDEMLFEGDSHGVGYLNFKQFDKHVSDFIANCMDADKKAADIVAAAVHGHSGSARISQKQLKEQARCSSTTMTIVPQICSGIFRV